ncbi:MAG: hypothetical protein KDD67_00240 [Ignavibacteriae bacterium]|nr:hypothetical protein [Ignavibacteriota bacterium]MCB9214735.1 hypothetical protein [Ignavibacteria bacterium]
MKAYFKQLDRILRGEATSESALKFGSIMIPFDKILITSILLAAFSGLCMGVFALINGNDALIQRMVSTILKVPILFFLTLFITFPSLYAFNAIVGSRLEITTLLRLLVAAIGVMTTILASLGPIVAFFSISATSYPFMLLLNVAVFAISGLLGFRFLHRTLDRLTPPTKEKVDSIQDDRSIPSVEKETFIAEKEVIPEGVKLEPDFLWFEETLHPPHSLPGPLDKTSEEEVHPKVRIMFRIWVVVFGLVGAQMGWILRPFIGNPNIPFQWFRDRESSFFEAVIYALKQLTIS